MPGKEGSIWATPRTNHYVMHIYLSWAVYSNNTWSDIVNLMAVTMVVLIMGESVFRDSCSLGKSAAGLMRVSLPRHSATTLRVPSSTHSVCRNSCVQMSLTNPCRTFTPSGLLLCRLMIYNGNKK